MFHLDRALRINARFNIHKNESGWDWDIQKNCLYKHRGFFINTFFALTFNKWLEFKNRKLLVGYDRDEVNANIEVGVDKGAYNEWNVKDLIGSLSYDLRERGLFGLQIDLNPHTISKEVVTEVSSFKQ